MYCQITKNESLELVHEYLRSKELEVGTELVVQEEKTIEKAFGWVYFYNSKEFVDSKDTRHLLAGNAPLIVDRFSGKLQETGTAHPIDFYIEEYERTQNCSNTDN